ncbi:MAG: pyridoxine 5'-phosphate synthase [Myxococcales bacterium]|nr:pyridoxine 5'-phosphate synthase [Myxococcales bacterium]USN51810.1 MAG: pyridoxine 5'-phosphate synthase [Myxococcales bacterium]
MTKLSVNVNKFATLRNARGGNNPDVLKMVLLIESLGVDGITVHPRPDERHIKKSDVYLLKNNLKTEFNIEGYPSKDFIALVNEIRPEQVTLVPDPPHVITSNAGFKLQEDFLKVKHAVASIKPSGARVSLFIEPLDFKHRSLDIIKETGADRVELYTERYASSPKDSHVLEDYYRMAHGVKKLGMGINAGHDLDLDNLGALLDAIPIIDEVSIGHALVCDALIMGIKETISKYLAIAHKARS